MGVNGPTRVALRRGSKLTHPAVAAPAITGLHLVVSGTVSVDATSSIDVSDRGCAVGYRWNPAGSPPGCTTNGSSGQWAGGSYGGLGGAASGGTPNATYGDSVSPSEPGSGGVSHSSSGAGGGLLRLTAAALVLDGTILANGQSQQVGAGSGGGVYVNAGTLSGGGSIEAKGGNSTGGYGGGGGGRIALYYAASTHSGMVSAAGGTGTVPGAAGTTYSEDTTP